MAAEFNLGDAILSITASTEGLNKALGNAQSAVQKSMGNILNITQKAGAAMAAAGTGILAGLGAAALSAAKYGDDIQEMSQRTGLGTDALQELGYAADQSGTNMGGIETAVKKMQKAIVTAGIETGKSADSLKQDQADAAQAVQKAQEQVYEAMQKGVKGHKELASAQGRLAEAQRKQNALMEAGDGEMKGSMATLALLGLSYQDLEKLKPEDQFFKIAGKLAEVEDATRRSAYAQKIFGKSGTDLLPMLAGGAKGLDLMRAQAHELGLVMKKDGIEKAGEFNDSWDALKKQLKMVGMEIGTALLPTLGRLVEKLKPVVANVIDWFDHNPGLTETIAKWAGALSLAAVPLGSMAISLPFILPAVGQFGTVIGAVIGGGTIGATAGLTGFVGLGVALAALVGGSGLLIHFNDTIREMMNDRFPRLTIVLDTIGGCLKTIWEWIKKIGEEIEIQFPLIKAFVEAMKWLFDHPDIPHLGDHTNDLIKQGLVNADGTQKGPLYDPHVDYHYANGTNFARGGLSLVGERGPELVNLPRGSRVYPANETAGMLAGAGGQTFNISIHTNSISDLTDAAIENVFSRMGRIARRRAGR